MLLKKILVGIFRKIKLPFSILKTKLLIFKTKTFNDGEYKSASDNGEYPELALKEALDPTQISLNMFQGNKVKNISILLEGNIK